MVGERIIAAVVKGHNMKCTLFVYYNNFTHKVIDDQISVKSSPICHFLNMDMILSHRGIINFQFSG